MTIDVTESFEGGANGATVDGTNTTFTAFGGTATDLTISTEQAILGTKSMKAVFAGNFASVRQPYTLRNVTYARLYVYFPTSLPSNGIFVTSLNGSTNKAQLRIDTTGHLDVRNATTNVYTSTTVFSVNTWYRIEWRLDAALSQQQVRIYAGHSSTALEDSGSVSYTGGQHDRISYGTTNAQTFTAYYDALQTRDDTWPGSAGTAPAITSSSVGTATVGTAFSHTVTTTGTPTPTLTQGGSLPTGLSFTDNGNGTGTLSGTPTVNTGSPYAVTFTAANTVTPNATQNYTLTVNASGGGGSAGTYGDPLQKSMNRLAGTTGMDAQGAANVWAGTTGLDLLGALNAKNASVGLGLNAVLNALAGTTGLDADGAAVQILA